jgi:arsenate reductase-like glutaredoxin family protein
MNVQVIGIKRCQDTNKAVRFFKERKIQFHFVDLNERPLSKGELNNISRYVGLENLMDKDGKEYKNQQLEYKVYDLETILLENPLLLKTPIVRIGQKSSLGFQQDLWKEWLK